MVTRVRLDTRSVCLFCFLASPSSSSSFHSLGLKTWQSTNISFSLFSNKFNEMNNTEPAVLIFFFSLLLLFHYSQLVSLTLSVLHTIQKWSSGWCFSIFLATAKHLHTYIYFVHMETNVSSRVFTRLFTHFDLLTLCCPFFLLTFYSLSSRLVNLCRIIFSFIFHVNFFISQSSRSLCLTHSNWPLHRIQHTIHIHNNNIHNVKR